MLCVFDRNQILAMLAGATGGAIAIASMEVFSVSTGFPLVAIPFATSIVTVLGSPKAEQAQPRALIGGHVISTLVGLLVVKLCGPESWAAALAVGLAMVATPSRLARIRQLKLDGRDSEKTDDGRRPS
jgi:CBS-domain-containing membrane protein